MQKFESEEISRVILTNFICWYLPIRRPKFVGVFPDCGSSSKSPVLFCEGAIEISRTGNIENRFAVRSVHNRFTVISLYALTYISVACSTTNSATSSVRSIICCTSSKLRSMRDTPDHSSTYTHTAISFQYVSILLDINAKIQEERFLLFDICLSIIIWVIIIFLNIFKF